MIPGIEVNPERMRAAAAEGHATATDLADYLVQRGMPFRDAHEAVARAVRAADAKGCDLAALPLPELQGFAREIGADVYAVLKIEGALASRAHRGGTAPAQVLEAVRRARTELS
jgi:argininosuccinate lyase